MKKYGMEASVVGVIGMVLFVLIATNTVPTVASATNAATWNGTSGVTNVNLTNGSLPLTQLMPLLYVALILVGVTRFL